MRLNGYSEEVLNAALSEAHAPRRVWRGECQLRCSGKCPRCSKSQRSPTRGITRESSELSTKNFAAFSMCFSFQVRLLERYWSTAVVAVR
jgi:hypothetical protein